MTISGGSVSFSSIGTILVIALMSQQAGNTGALHGHITLDGQPVASATISLFRLNQEASGFTENISSKSDGSGLYEFRGLVPSEYVLLVSSGNRRLYQGKITIATQTDTVKDVIVSSESVQHPTVSPAPPLSTHDPLLKDVQPMGLAFLPSGMVILDGSHNRERLLQARASGLAVVPTGVFQYPHDIAAAEIDGRQFIFLIWTSPTSGSWLTVYSADGATWNAWSPSVHGDFSTVVTDPSTHTTYLGIRTADDVELIQLSDQSVLSRQPHPFLPFSITGTVGGNQSPSGPAAVDSANARLFLATTTGGILTVDLKTPGSRPTPLTLPKGLGIPEALAFDSVGHTLYVGAGHHLWAVDVGSSSPIVSEFPPHHRFGRVTALGLDSDHRLWVGDWDARALYLMSVSGQMIQTLH